MQRGSQGPLRVGTAVSLCLHLLLFAIVMLFVHGAAVAPPPPRHRVILTLNLAAPAPPPPLAPPVAPPPPKLAPPPKLKPLPRPLPMPVTSHATAKAAPQVPPPPVKPVPQPVAPAKAPPAPVARPAPVKPQPGVVGHHVSSNYKNELEAQIRSNLHYPVIAQRQGRQGTALVRVRMKRDGTILSIKLVKSSDTDSLDREAQDVFHRIGKLPPLPADFLPQASEFEFEVPITFRLLD